MNQYTPEQMKDLIQEFITHEIYQGQILYLFNLESFSEEEGIQYCLDYKKVYDKMNNFRWKKVLGNYPSKEVKHKVKKIRDIIFKIKFDMVPLHISDPVTAPIASWRLKNGI